MEGVFLQTQVGEGEGVEERGEVAERGRQVSLPVYLGTLSFHIFHINCSFPEYVLASVAGALLWFAGAVDYSAPEAFQGPKQNKKWMVKR